MPQPSISGMEPPFGDAFQNYSFADQALTSTDLLSSSSDPDFMYELDRELCPRPSTAGEGGVAQREGCTDHVSGLGGEGEPVCSGPAFEQWDSYWEDLTRYTRLASCDIWGTKEVDFLGLDDFSSPYQDEEEIGRTPTLAQLNSEDSQPVCETLYPSAEPPLPGTQLQSLLPPPPPPGHNKRPPGFSFGPGPPATRPSPAPTSSLARPFGGPLPDFPEGSQKATWPVASSTETMAKTARPLTLLSQDHVHFKTKGGHPGATGAPPPHGAFLQKAKVRVSAAYRTQTTDTLPRHPEVMGSDVPPPLLSQPPEERASTSGSSPGAGGRGAGGGAACGSACGTREGPPLSLKRSGPAAQADSLEGCVPGLGGASEPLDAEESAEKINEEEHNYSLFLTQARLAGRATSLLEDEEDEEEVKPEEEEEEGEEEEEQEEEDDGEAEEEEEEEGEGLELDDEDHDEGFGSEHELSENEEEEEEEEEEDDDYEADKDDDMSDAFSEPGYDMELGEDVRGLTAGVSSRKRGKRRYFWEYSEQLTPSKHERMLKPSEWDRNTLPSNLYQRNGPLHGKYKLKKSRRTDVEDLTPNPRKLLQIGTELRKLNKVISDLIPVSELPFTARPRSRKEKNKLASRACRLKKKAQYEANKVKLWGLSTEYDRLLFVINAIKEEIVTRVKVSAPQAINMADTLERLVHETLVSSPVAGQTSDFVNQILETTGQGDPTGGLVGLRVPTSKS